MVRGWRTTAGCAALGITAVMLLGGCKGTYGLNGDDPNAPARSAELENPFPPCTDPDLCCPVESIAVMGSPDDEQRVCLTLWECDDPEKPYKCTAPLTLPFGGSNWQCTWTESSYICDGKAAAGEDVPGGAGWDCVDDPKGEFVDYRCTYAYPPNPGNNPGGTAFYTCKPQGEFDKLECEPKGSVPATPTTPVTPKGGTDQPKPEPKPVTTEGPNFGPWTKSESGGKTVWKRSGAAPLDDGICTREAIGGQMTLVCFGDTPNPEGQSGYDCQHAAEFDKDYCTTPLTDSHRPEGMGDGVCSDIIEFGQIIQVCEETTEPPNAMPAPGSKCEPKTRRWCDGVTLCGWGIIECNDDGTWPTTRKQDRYGRWHVVEACDEHPEGLRPDTACANYYWFFNPECCERDDCVIEPGTNGRAYARSAGNLCDPCNPTRPECDMGRGSLCVYRRKTIRSDLIGGRTFATGETYCGQQCGGNLPCPEGFTCTQACAVGIAGQRQVCGMQCVPDKDGSCYLRAQN